MPEQNREIEIFATAVHAVLSAVHGRAAAARGEVSPEVRGAAVALRGLSVGYNAPRGNSIDVVAHIAGIAVMTLRPGSRLLHAVVSLYDAQATWKHARRLL